MLPFLKHSQEASVSAPAEVKKRKPDQEEEFDHIEACAQELHDAMKSGDIKGIAMALRSAFTILDSEPHVEGPHEGEE